MRVTGGKDFNMDRVREIIRTLRKVGVVEEKDGYHHLEVTEEAYRSLCIDPKFFEVYIYMTEENKHRVQTGEGIQGIYGAYITPRFEPWFQVGKNGTD